MNLLQNKYHYATELLGERETYVLLRVTNGEKPSETEFRPLLKDEHIINPKFLELYSSFLPKVKLQHGKTPVGVTNVLKFKSKFHNKLHYSQESLKQEP
ncbi:hypothetical protein E2320_007143 [Naja naja]|nr:hypothetical protein E2320_007143 [Naja naja]